MVLTATGVASLVYAATQRSLLGFSLTFAVTLWSPLNVILSTGTFDNAFGMVLLFCLWILRWTGPTWWRGIVLAIVAGLIGWTHIETYALFLFIVALYEVLRLYRHKSIRLWWAHEYDIITAILSGVLVGVWHWSVLWIDFLRPTRRKSAGRQRFHTLRPVCNTNERDQLFADWYTGQYCSLDCASHIDRSGLSSPASARSRH